MTNTLSNNNNTTTDAVSYNSGLITPVDIDNIPIIYEGNPAHIPGLLHEFGGWVERSGNFKELIEHGAVLLSNGKVAFDSVNSVKFYRGDAVDGDTYTLLNPCPSTSDRINRFDAEANVAETPLFATFMTAPLDHNLIVQPLTVQKKDRQLAESILSMWQDSDEKGEFQTECASSGRTLIYLLIAEGAKATAADHGLVEEQLTNYIKAGVVGDISLKSFNKYAKGFQILNRRIVPHNRKSDAGEMQMWHTAIMKDPSLRMKYEIKLETQKPATSKAVLTLIRTMLRTDQVYSQLDEEMNGGSRNLTVLTIAQRIALVSANFNLDRLKSEDAIKIANTLITTQEALAADPRKNTKIARTGAEWREKKPPNYDDWPRDECGNITKWVKGMGLCGCNSKLGGTGIGEHPRRLCPEKKWADNPMYVTKTIKLNKALAAEKSPEKQTSLVAPIVDLEAKIDEFYHAPRADDRALPRLVHDSDDSDDPVDPASNAMNAQLQAFFSSSVQREPHDDKVQQSLVTDVATPIETYMYDVASVPIELATDQGEKMKTISTNIPVTSKVTAADGSTLPKQLLAHFKYYSFAYFSLFVIIAAVISEGSRLQPVEQLTVRVEQLALRQTTSIASPLKPRAPKSPRAPAPPARWWACAPARPRPRRVTHRRPPRQASRLSCTF